MATANNCTERSDANNTWSPTSLVQGQEPFPIALLPDLVHEKVLSKLTFKELIIAGLVSRRWFANCNRVLRGITTLSIAPGHHVDLHSLCPIRKHSFEPYTFLLFTDKEKIDLICNLVSRLPNLVAFYMYYSTLANVTDATYRRNISEHDATKLLEVLSGCKDLEHIEMPYFKLPNFDFSRFKKLSCVDHIQFADCPNLKYVRDSWFFNPVPDAEQEDTDLQLQRFSRLVPKLKWLECFFYRDDIAKLHISIMNGKNLEKLDIHNRDTGGEITLLCDKLKNLKILGLEGSLEELLCLKKLPKLESLRIGFSDYPTSAEDVRQILEPIGQRLKHLDFGNGCCTDLTLETILAIVETCPNLEVLCLAPDPSHVRECVPALSSIFVGLSKLYSLEIRRLACSDEQLIELLKKMPCLKYFKGWMAVNTDSKKNLEMFERIRREFPEIVCHFHGVYEDPAMKFVRTFHQ